MRLDNRGDLTLNFGCPPDYDTIARDASTAIGTCDTTVTGTGAIRYRLPSRVQGGVALRPLDRLRLEVMGGVVFWSVFEDYEIQPSVPPSAFSEAQGGSNALVASSLSSSFRPWARDNRNSGWLGVDAKVELTEKLTVGGRALFDRAAVPTSTLNANNYDADSLALSGLVDLAALPAFLGRAVGRAPGVDTPHGDGLGVRAVGGPRGSSGRRPVLLSVGEWRLPRWDHPDWADPSGAPGRAQDDRFVAVTDDAGCIRAECGEAARCRTGSANVTRPPLFSVRGTSVCACRGRRSPPPGNRRSGRRRVADPARDRVEQRTSAMARRSATP